MKLIALGTAGYHPTERRQTACFLLPELGIVLDAGTGMFRLRERLATTQLDIYLTHAHLDHVAGLTFLLDVFNGKPMERVTIHALADKLEAVDKHLLDELIFPVKLPYEMRPLVQDAEIAGGGKLRHFRWCIRAGRLGFGSIGLIVHWLTSPTQRRPGLVPHISTRFAASICYCMSVTILTGWRRWRS